MALIASPVPIPAGFGTVPLERTNAPDATDATPEWRRVVDVLNKHYYQPDVEAARALYASIAAHGLDGQPVWPMLVGPPGSMKTEMIRALDGMNNFHSIDAVTPKGPCGNTYIRQEKLGDLLGDVIKPIQITEDVARDIAQALRASDCDAESQRAASLQQVENRRRTVVSKIDRGYEDYVSERISEAFWTRKSAEWEAELQTVDAERARLERPRASAVATAEKILELAKKAESRYKSQNPVEQRRLLETVLSNCTFDSGRLSPTYSKPFDLFVRGNETGEWRGRRDSNPRPPP
jgi:hypothetical protein